MPVKPQTRLKPVTTSARLAQTTGRGENGSRSRGVTEPDEHSAEPGLCYCPESSAYRPRWSTVPVASRPNRQGHDRRRLPASFIASFSSLAEAVLEELCSAGDPAVAEVRAAILISTLPTCAGSKHGSHEIRAAVRLAVAIPAMSVRSVENERCPRGTQKSTSKSRNSAMTQTHTRNTP